MSSDIHPLDAMAARFEAEADDPSCWEPEMFVEAKYGDLFKCEVGETEWEDKDGIDGSFYYINPNDLHITVEITDTSPDAKDKLCISFNVYTMFVYHTDEDYQRGKTEVTAELVNSESECIHEFDFCEYKEWVNWPDPETLKTWIAGKINEFLAGFGRVSPVGIDNIRP